jgi:hypothetical protein
MAGRDYDIKIVRLVTGEELVAKVSKKSYGNPDEIELFEPHVIVLRPDSTGTKVGLALGAWIAYKKGDSVKVNWHSVMALIEPHENLAKQYMETISPLVLPTSKLTL